MTTEYKDLTALEQKLLTMDVHAQHIRGGIIDNDWTLEDWSEYRHLKNTYFLLKKYEQSRRSREARFRDIKRKYCCFPKATYSAEVNDDGDWGI